jgi:hypothetical protein
MTKIHAENPHTIAPAIYGSTWTDELDDLLRWTWIEAIEKELARRKERAWRRAVALGTALAEDSALYTLRMKAKQVAELGHHRAKIVGALKTRAWDLACHRMSPGHA